MTDNLAVLLDRLLPEGVEPILRGILGNAMPKIGDGNRYRIAAAGQFRGSIVADLLSFAKTQQLDAALVLIEEDTHRVLYFHEGMLVAADSNVLFERLGRVLFKGGVIDKKDANALVDCEERAGLERAIQLVPGEAAYWGLERRVWNIGAGLYFMGHAHFLFIEGKPDLGSIPLLAIEPVQLAMEGLRRYDEWRNGPPAASTDSKAATDEAPERTALDRSALGTVERGSPKAAGPPREAASPGEEADEIMRKLMGDI